MTKYTNAHAAKDLISFQKPNFVPKYVFILGSGLGPFADQLEDSTVISYDQLPGFPVCGVAGHAGTLNLGTINNIPVACLSGRPHIYDYPHADEIFKTFIRTFKLLGSEAIISTNASGSLREDVPPGDLMLVNDLINFQFTNVLVGPNDDQFGDRFPPMGDAFDEGLRAKFQTAAKNIDLDLKEGVYIGTSGPCFETAAEIRAFKTLGADAVGMSLAQETIVACHCGLKVGCIAVITNFAEGMSAEKLSHDQTLKGAKMGIEKLIKLLTAFCI